MLFHLAEEEGVKEDFIGFLKISLIFQFRIRKQMKMDSSETVLFKGMQIPMAVLDL